MANRVKVQHFSRIKNDEKIALFMPQIMGRVKIPGPPLLPLKKRPFVKITENTATRVKGQHFWRTKNYEKIALFMSQIMGRVKIPGPPLPLAKKNYPTWK